MEYYELIEKYFSNQMSVEEKSMFDDLLENDRAFQKEFVFQQNLKKAITKTNRDQGKVILQGVEKDLKETRPSKRLLQWKPLSIAASIILLIGIGWYFGIFFPPDFQELYADNYQAYPNTEYSISRSSDENTLERRAFFAYETENYLEAISLFNELKEQGAHYADFYLGQSYLGNDQMDEAITVFKDVISKNEAFVQESKWYLAIGYLKIGDKKRAIAQLEEIKTGYNQKEAAQLLEQLD